MCYEATARPETRKLARVGRHCLTYLGPPDGPIQRLKPVRYVQYECYETTARSETRNTKIGPRATCALPRLGNMALKVAKMGT
jgi:hypothetical protein